MAKTAHYECDVVTAEPGASCIELAESMDRRTVGCVVVADDGVASGIVTDRDLVCRVIAEGRDPEKTKASDVMSRDVETAERGADIEHLLGKMGERGIRRIPLTEDGRLVSLFSLDDLMQQISSYLFNYTQGQLHGLQESRRTTRTRRRQESREDALDEVRRQLTEFGEQARDRVKGELQKLLDRL